MHIFQISFAPEKTHPLIPFFMNFLKYLCSYWHCSETSRMMPQDYWNGTELWLIFVVLVLPTLCLMFHCSGFCLLLQFLYQINKYLTSVKDDLSSLHCHRQKLARLSSKSEASHLPNASCSNPRHYCKQARDRLFPQNRPNPFAASIFCKQSNKESNFQLNCVRVGFTLVGASSKLTYL